MPPESAIIREKKKAFLRIHQNRHSKKPQSTISDSALSIHAVAGPLDNRGQGDMLYRQVSKVPKL
jgi:hypothetical protein